MEKFKISDIQEIFVSDVERFHSLTQNHVTHLLSETTPSQESLDDALRQCHTLKGLAATVEAWGLSCLGADLEKLLELAGSWMNNEREKANGIFEFILDHMQDWYVMNQFTCMDMLPQAWDIYLGLRGTMDERWPGYLPPPASADGENAHYVRLTDLEIPETPAVAQVTEAAPPVQQPVPELDVREAQPIASTPPPSAPTPLRVVPPTLRQRTEPPESSTPAKLPVAVEGLDVQQSEPIAHVEQPAAPKPLRVVPPTLRGRDHAAAPAIVENLSASPSSPDAPAGEPVAPVDQPAAPKPLQVVPPSLRRRKAAHAAEAAAVPAPVAPTSITPAAQTDLPPAVVVPPISATPVEPVQQIEAAAPATPPILRVAPPALKRRAKKTEPTAEAVVEAAAMPAPVEQLSVPPLAVEPTAIVPAAVEPLAVEPPAITPAPVEALSAEDVFASLPAEIAPAELVPLEAVSTEITPTAPVPEELKPSTATQTLGDVSDLLEMLSQEVAGYLTDLTANLTTLAGNLADEAQWEQTRRLFHTIKGTAATFNLDAVSAPAKAAEARCIVAVEDVNARTREAFELCVHRAQVVAKALHLPFDDSPLREALETGLAQAANLAAMSSAPAAGTPLDPEMAGFFINDTRDQIEIIEQAVLRWERLPAGQTDQAKEQVNAAQRGFHTIKGAGNSIGLTAVAQSVHEVEAFLEGVAAAGAVGSKPLFTFLLGAVDQLRHYLADLTKNTASPWRHDWNSAIRLFTQPEARGQQPADGSPMAAVVQAAMSVEVAEDDAHTLRIEAARLYQVMNLIGEMVIDRARLAKKIEQLTSLHRALAERNGALTGSVQAFQQQFEFNLMESKGRESSVESREPASGPRPSTTRPSTVQGHGEFSEIEFDRYDQFNVLARSLVEISHDIEELNAEVAACLESFSAENVQFTQTSQSLQSKVTSLSLVPVNTLFPRLQRAFRDALNVEAKEADLSLVGGEALLDKVVVDKVYAPLLHLLRNAVAHGIEDAVARDKAKKPARGQVRLSAQQLANQIVLQIADDGAGVNAQAVRKRAIEKGWLPKDAPELSADQVVHFIFQPGFSTAAKVTSVSGRGVGLDVVRTEIENLNGSVELRFEPGKGSTWTLRLPLTLSISEAILAKLGDTTFAFPLNFIEYGVIMDGPTKRGADGRELYVLEGSGAAAEGADGSDTSHFARDTVTGVELPVVRLAHLLGLPGDASSNKGLIVGVGERRAVVVVDVVLARQEIVNKQLDSVMAMHPLLNGASLDAEGRVIPILNLPTLLKFAEQGVLGEGPVAARPERVKGEGQLRVLIVDDSLSVRKVQERQLADLGCKVTAAADGLHALERLREGVFDFVFTDLEMPRLNGYELISELRGNPAWAGLPIVVISSRGADKYITKAMNLGASTFLSKPFTQEQLQQVLLHFAPVAARGK